MGVDWAEALRIGGTGFGTVFLVLIILAAAISLTGLVVRRASRRQDSIQKEG